VVQVSCGGSDNDVQAKAVAARPRPAIRRRDGQPRASTTAIVSFFEFVDMVLRGLVRVKVRVLRDIGEVMGADRRWRGSG
jgi:hypothetical protein